MLEGRWRVWEGFRKPSVSLFLSVQANQTSTGGQQKEWQHHGQEQSQQQC